jgi:hypothetical protein
MKKSSIFATVLYLFIINSFINLTAREYQNDNITKYIKVIKFKHNKTL